MSHENFVTMRNSPFGEYEALPAPGITAASLVIFLPMLLQFCRVLDSARWFHPGHQWVVDEFCAAIRRIER